MGCFERVVRGDEYEHGGYCPDHVKSVARWDRHVGQGFRNDTEFRKMFGALATTKDDQTIFSKMLITLEECKQQLTRNPTDDRSERLDFLCRMEELKQDIISEATNPLSPPSQPPPPTPPPTNLHDKLQQRIRQKHTEARTSTAKNTKVNRKIHKKIKRIIREAPSGEKVTEEHEETEDQSEKFETLVQFKTERELEVFVEETTERYESKLNEYAQNRDLVFGSLEKWFADIAQERIRDNLDTTLSIRELIQSSLDLFQKQTIMYWQLWTSLWPDSAKPITLPILQQIVYYNVETLADGPRKMFHCRFSDHKLSSNSIVLSVPEVLMRALPGYTDVIHAFFVSKFIPFKKIFMKYRRQQELGLRSPDPSEVEDILNRILEEEEVGGFQDDKFPEINARVCFHKKT
jgi:hypothetical protein